MFAPSLSLAFEAHIWFINTLIFLSVCSKFLDRHSENITCLFGDENEQYSSIVIGLKKILFSTYSLAVLTKLLSDS